MTISVKKITDLMLQKGLNYSDLSERSKISKPHISRIMNLRTKKVRIKTIKAIADGLGVDCQSILEGENENE